MAITLYRRAKGCLILAHIQDILQLTDFEAPDDPKTGANFCSYLEASQEIFGQQLVASLAYKH